MTTFLDVCRMVEDNYRRERETGFLCLDAMRQAIAFSAARTIAEAGRADDLDGLPPWLVSEIYRWMEVYATEGKLTFFFFNVGEVDHSSLAEQLARILPPKNSIGPSVDLLTNELLDASGILREYFTYYLSAPHGVKVRHGLHREYTEGTLIETEFRHGAPIGQPRAFNSKGQEIGRPG